jgi:hypothetical protein
MTPTTLKENEFVVSVLHGKDKVIFSVRNPHIEHPNDNEYNDRAFITLVTYLAAAEKLKRIKRKNEPIPDEEEDDDESDS